MTCSLTKLLVFCLLIIGSLSCLFAQSTDSLPTKTQFLTLHEWNYGYYTYDSLTQDAQKLIFWDDADLMKFPYVRTLGQVGKPAMIFNLPFSNLPADDFSGLSMPYNWSSENTLFINTRTFFVRPTFTQAGNKTQNLGLILSKNLNPYANITLQSQRRTSVGAYLNNVTDHWNILANSHFISKNQRHALACIASFQELKDNLNGGTLQDSTSDPINSFNKNAQPILLQDAKWIRKTQNLHLLYNFTLIPQTLTLHTQYAIELFQWIFIDDAIDSNLIALSTSHNPFNQTIPPSINMHYGFQQQMASIAWSFMKPSWLARTASEFKQYRYNGNIFIPAQNLFAQQFDFYFQKNAWFFSTTNSLKYSNLLKMSNEHSLTMGYKTPNLINSFPLGAYEDTTATTPDSSTLPKHAFLFHLLLQNRYPLLRDLFNALPYTASNPKLHNFQILNAKIEYNFQKNNLQFSLKPFLQLVSKPIYYDAESQIIQSNESHSFLGANLSTRFTIRKNFLDFSLFTYKAFNSQVGVTDRMPSYLPTLTVGRKQLFRSLVIQFQLTHRFIPQAQAYLFDHLNFWWYPLPNQKMPDMLLGDIFASVKFRKALIFLRINNLYENLWAAGYYTTYYHPMLHRTLHFGITWDFFD